MGENNAGRPKGSKNKFNGDKLSDAEFDEFFSSIPQDYVIKITRIEPEWCSGYVGSIHCDPSQPFNIQKMKENFGGSLFDCKICNDQGKYAGGRRVRISAIPRDGNGVDEDPDNFTKDGAYRRRAMKDTKSDKQQNVMTNPFGMNINSMPNEIQKKMWRWFLLGDEEGKKRDTTAELMQQKMMMDMMQAQTNHQLAIQKSQLEYQREFEKLSRSRELKEPLGDVQTTIALLRELNGMKTEFGGSDNVATEIIAQTAPIIETAISEILKLQKLKVQGEIAKTNNINSSSPPPLPPGQNSLKKDTVLVSDTKPFYQEDPVHIAKRMGEIFRSLNDEQQGEVLSAFLGQKNDTDQIDSDNLIEKNYNETVSINDNDDMLDEEDRAILSDEENATNQDDDVSDGEYSGAIETDDSTDWESDKVRIDLSSD